MSKSAFVMKTPENCDSCRLGEKKKAPAGEFILCKLSHTLNDIGMENRPEWCYLTLLPEKLTYENSYKCVNDDYRDGWNDCIEEITGERRQREIEKFMEEVKHEQERNRRN